jgi:transposase
MAAKPSGRRRGRLAGRAASFAQQRMRNFDGFASAARGGLDCEQMPRPEQLPFALWTAQAVRELMHNKFGKTLGLSTMQLYLKRWGFSARKPLTRATQRDPQKIAAWLEQDYPSIAARAKRERAAISWSDETGVCNQDQIGRGYAPKGQTPILTQTGQKFSTSMIAAVSNRGLMRFRLYKGALNVAIFTDFSVSSRTRSKRFF